MIFSGLVSLAGIAGLVGAAGLAGCTHFDELAPEPAAGEQAGAALTAEEVRAEALWASAVWDEQTEQWLRPQNDPYKLENFQRAYDNLVAGRHQIPTTAQLKAAEKAWAEAARAAKTGSTVGGGKATRADAAGSKDAVATAKAPEAAVQAPEGAVWAEVTEAVAKEFARKANAPKKLQATHRAVKVWPRTEDEQELLERDEELDVRYYPIEYVAVVGEDAKLLASRMSATNSLGEKALPNETRYTVVEEGGMTEYGPTEPRTITMPTLYVVWPVGKPYPAGMDYEEQYEIFLPQATETAMDALPETNLGAAGTIENGLVTAVPKKGAGSGTNLSSAALTLNLSTDALQALEFEAIEIALRGAGEELGRAGLTAEAGDASAAYGTHFVPKGGGWAPDKWYNPDTGEFDLPVGGGTNTGGLDDDWRWTYTTKPAMMNVSGVVQHWNKSSSLPTDPMNIYVPLAGLTLHVKIGSNRIHRGDIITDSGGAFWNGGYLISSDATITFFFRNDSFKITRRDSNTTLERDMGTVWENYNQAQNCLVIRPSEPGLPLYETHRAADFYFHRGHPIPVYTYNDPLKIEVSSEARDDWSGLFHYGLAHPLLGGRCFIEIAHNAPNRHGYTIGTVLHELGHWTQWRMKGDFSKYDGTHNIIHESWASYVGWELSERYYQMLGNQRSDGSPVSPQDRQDWFALVQQANKWKPYSPLFVDLRDNYEEWASTGVPFTRDGIHDIDYEVLNRLAKESRTYADFKRIFSEYYEAYSSETNRVKEMKLMEYFYVWDAWF